MFKIVSPELRCSVISKLKKLNRHCSNNQPRAGKSPGDEVVATTTTLHVHHNFRAFLSLRARVYNVKFPNRTICDEKSVHSSRDRYDKETDRFTCFTYKVVVAAFFSSGCHVC